MLAKKPAIVLPFFTGQALSGDLLYPKLLTRVIYAAGRAASGQELLRILVQTNDIDSGIETAPCP